MKILTLGILFLSPIFLSAQQISGTSTMDVEMRNLPKMKKSAPSDSAEKVEKKQAETESEQTSTPTTTEAKSEGEILKKISRQIEPAVRKQLIDAGASGEMLSVSENAKDYYPYVVKVSDFGAIADDGLDDAEAIRKAVESVAGKKGVRIVFSTGTYDIYNLEKGYAGVRFENIEKLMLDGGGATIMLHSVGSDFVFKNCSNVILNNIDFDCFKLPFVGGKVVAVEKTHFDCIVPMSHEILEFAPRAVNLYDIQNNAFMSGLDIYLKTDRRVEKLSANKMRVPLDKNSDSPAVDDTVIVRYQVYGAPAITFSGGKNIRIYNVNIWNHSGSGIYFEAVADIHLDNSNIIPKNDAVWMTSTADGLVFKYCRGKIEISNCIFERCGGDAINVHQMYWLFSEKIDPHVIKLKYGKARAGMDLNMAPKKGDVLEFSDPDNWLRGGFQSEVISVEENEKEKYLLVELSQMLPDKILLGTPVSNASANPALKISSCSVYSTRARGFAIHTRSAIVENCVFNSTLLPAILMECDNKDWFEGASVDDILITDCVFTNCNTGRAESSAAIFAHARYSDESKTDGDINGTISIQNCKFEKCSDAPVQLNKTKNTLTKSNVIVE